MKLSPRLYIDAAEYLGSTLDLGNATQAELDAMLSEAIMALWEEKVHQHFFGTRQ